MLRLLNLQNNSIRKIENLLGLPNLIFLDLYNNGVGVRALALGLPPWEFGLHLCMICVFLRRNWRTSMWCRTCAC